MVLVGLYLALFCVDSGRVAATSSPTSTPSFAITTCDSAAVAVGAASCMSLPSDGRIVEYYTTQKTWENARVFCDNRGLKMLSIHSDAETRAIFSLMETTDDPNGQNSRRAWIGLSDGATEGTWVWDDNSITDYFNWYPGEPAANNVNTNCVHFFGPSKAGSTFWTQAFEKHWNDAQCTNTMRFFCSPPFGSTPSPSQTPTATRSPVVSPIPCPSDAISAGASSCQIMTYDNRVAEHYTLRMTYADAQAHCVSRGLLLLSIHSEEENEYLWALVSQELFPNKHHRRSWIGLNDITTEGVYVWEDGSNVGYSNWYFTDPSGAPGKNCVLFLGPASDFTYWSPIGQKMWSDEACNELLRFTCAPGVNGTKSPSLPPSTYPSLSPTTTCPLSAQSAGAAACVYLPMTRRLMEVYSNRKTFADAQTFCQGRGLELVSLHSVAEVTSLKDAQNAIGFTVDNDRRIWIGLTDQTVEGSFEWTDGSLVDFTNWMSFNPDNIGNSDCTVQYSTGTPSTSWGNVDGYWDDINCLRFARFACAPPLTLTPSTSPSFSPTTCNPTSLIPSVAPQMLSPSCSPTSQPTYNPTSLSPTTTTPTSRHPTMHPTSESPSSKHPTSGHPTSFHPTSHSPSSLSPSTPIPLTQSPSSSSPQSPSPTTQAPSTLWPSTVSPSSSSPLTTSPFSNSPSSFTPSSNSPSTHTPTSTGPSTFGPTTTSPSTCSPSTQNPTSCSPSTLIPTSCSPTTCRPTSGHPTSIHPTSCSPTTKHPTSGHPTSIHPTSRSPTTKHPTSGQPTSIHPTSRSPTTKHPTSGHPTSIHPTSCSPTTKHPTSGQPTSIHPTSPSPTTKHPTSGHPTSMHPTSRSPTTKHPTSGHPTSKHPTSLSPSTLSPSTFAPLTPSPTSATPSQTPISTNPITFAPSTSFPSTCAPSTQTPASCSPNTFNPTSCSPTSCRPTSSSMNTTNSSTTQPTPINPTLNTTNPYYPTNQPTPINTTLNTTNPYYHLVSHSPTSSGDALTLTPLTHAPTITIHPTVSPTANASRAIGDVHKSTASVDKGVNGVIWFALGMLFLLLLTSILGCLLCPGGPATNTRDFWRAYNKVKLKRVVQPRSLQAFTTVLMWALARRNPWVSPLAHPLGDHLTLTKRLWVLSVLISAEMLLLALFLSFALAPSFVGAISSAIITPILLAPVPFLIGLLFERPTPQDLRLDPINPDRIPEKWTRIILGSLLSNIPPTKPHNTPGGNWDINDVDDVNDVNDVNDVDDVDDDDEGNHQRESIQVKSIRSIVDGNTSILALNAWGQKDGKDSKVVEIFEGGVVDGNTADREHEPWNTWDILMLALCQALVLGCLLCLWLLSSRFNDVVWIWIIGCIVCFLFDFLLRVIWIVLVEAVLVGPCWWCNLANNYKGATQVAPAPDDGKIMKEAFSSGSLGVSLCHGLGEPSSTQMLTFDSDKSIGFKLSKLRVSEVEDGSQANENNLKVGSRLLEVNGNKIDSKCDAKVFIREAQRTAKRFELFFVPMERSSLNTSALNDGDDDNMPDITRKNKDKALLDKDHHHFRRYKRGSVTLPPISKQPTNLLTQKQALETSKSSNQDLPGTPRGEDLQGEAGQHSRPNSRQSNATLQSSGQVGSKRSNSNEQKVNLPGFVEHSGDQMEDEARKDAERDHEKKDLEDKPSKPKFFLPSSVSKTDHIRS